MARDTFDLEMDMTRLAGSLRAVAGLCFAAEAKELDRVKAEDVGWLMEVLAAHAQRCAEDAGSVLHPMPDQQADIQVAALRSVMDR